MLGIFISILIALHGVVFQGATFEPVFLKATMFLYNWYVITSIIMGIILLLVVLGVIGVGSAAGGLSGFLATLIGGGAIGLLVAVLLVIKRGLFIFGAYLLHASLVLKDGIYVWNIGYVVVGALLLLIAIILGGASRSSSN